MPNFDFLFFTQEGRPLTKDGVGKIMACCGRKAGLDGVRCSPHTLRHTAAISFLRNGGDVFNLERMLGRASFNTTAKYRKIAEFTTS